VPDDADVQKPCPTVEVAANVEGGVDVPKYCWGVKGPDFNGEADVLKLCPSVEGPGVPAAAL
jgi:hypothetical protein